MLLVYVNGYYDILHGGRINQYFWGTVLRGGGGGNSRLRWGTRTGRRIDLEVQQAVGRRLHGQRAVGCRDWLSIYWLPYQLISISAYQCRGSARIKPTNLCAGHSFITYFFPASAWRGRPKNMIKSIHWLAYQLIRFKGSDKRIVINLHLAAAQDPSKDQGSNYKLQWPKIKDQITHSLGPFRCRSRSASVRCWAACNRSIDSGLP